MGQKEVRLTSGLLRIGRIGHLPPDPPGSAPGSIQGPLQVFQDLLPGIERSSRDPGSCLYGSNEIGEVGVCKSFQYIWIWLFISIDF